MLGCRGNMEGYVPTMMEARLFDPENRSLLCVANTIVISSWHFFGRMAESFCNEWNDFNVRIVIILFV